MGSISDYSKFTFSLCEQLSKENLGSMKFLLRERLTTREIEDVVKPEDLFVLLEQRNELGIDNLRLLQDLLREINRQDLVRKLNEFEREQLAKRLGNYNTVTEHSRSLNIPALAERDCVTDGKEKEEMIKADLRCAFPWTLESRALTIRKHVQDCNRDGREMEEKAIEALDENNSELSQTANRWKLDSRALNGQDRLQDCKRDAAEKDKENAIESSMSSEFSDLSVRSEDDAGDITLEQLEHKHQEVFDWMCLQLDNGRWWSRSRRDYERLAAKYKNWITKEQRLALCDELQNKGSPSKLLMSMLQTKYRFLPLSQFVKTLKEIGRKDIAQKLMPYAGNAQSQ